MSDLWKVVNNSNDINNLLDKYCGFHDSCICSVKYISGASVDSEGSMSYSSPDKIKLNN